MKYVLMMLMTLVIVAGARAEMAPIPEVKIPLGIYWPGEMIPGVAGKDEAAQWAYIETCLDDMKAHKVNAIWLTHQSVAYTARMARLAAPRGIGIVASCAELALEVDQHRNVEYVAAVAKGTRENWSDAPAPRAFGLGDEPRAGYMRDVGYLERVFRASAPAGSRTTAVMMPADLRSAFASVDFCAYCVDVSATKRIDGPSRISGGACSKATATTMAASPAVNRPPVIPITLAPSKPAAPRRGRR